MNLIAEKIIFEDGIDIISADYGPEWESLRRVAHAAVRKYAMSDRLAYLVNEVVDENIAAIKEKEGDNPFDPTDYLSIMIYQILASIAFGKRYTMDDPELLQFIKKNKEMQEKSHGAVVLCEAFPFMKIFFNKQYNNLTNTVQSIIKTIGDKYQE